MTVLFFYFFSWIIRALNILVFKNDPDAKVRVYGGIFTLILIELLTRCFQIISLFNNNISIAFFLSGY